MRLTGVAAAVAALLVVAGSAGGFAGAEPTPEPSPPPPPAPKTVIDKDGSYVVGADIVPGTYRSAGPVAGSACYWKRMRGDELIDNALTKKPQVVQIDPTDTMFKTDRCQTWQLTACPPDCAPAEGGPPPVLPGDARDFLPRPQPAPAGG